MNVKDTYVKAGWYPDPGTSGVRFGNGRSWGALGHEVNLLEAGPGGPLVLHGTVDPDYSYRAVARLSRRDQETTWPATAQKF
jgi:Protein of unknown function (DUF2510)